MGVGCVCSSMASSLPTLLPIRILRSIAAHSFLSKHFRSRHEPVHRHQPCPLPLLSNALTFRLHNLLILSSLLLEQKSSAASSRDRTYAPSTARAAREGGTVDVTWMRMLGRSRGGWRLVCVLFGSPYWPLCRSTESIVLAGEREALRV